MIRLERGPTPALFDSDRVLDWRMQAAEFFRPISRSRSQLKFPFEKLQAKFYGELALILAERFPAKCAYCEANGLEEAEEHGRLYSDIREFIQPDAFRPWQFATNLDGSSDSDHYWWLAFEWSNYLPACSTCIERKGNRFPVHGLRASPGSTIHDLRLEKCLLLDPCEDETGELLFFLDDGRVTSEDERAQVTIEILDLNRNSLVFYRRKNLRRFSRDTLIKYAKREYHESSLVDYSIKRAIAETRNREPFAAMRRQYAKAWAMDILRENPKCESRLQPLLEFKTALRSSFSERHAETAHASTALTERTIASEAFSVVSPKVSEHYYLKTRFIEHIELKDIRVFKSLDLAPPIGHGEQGGWYMLLGENGTGKSSILQAVACALAGQAGVERLKLRASDLLRHDAETGEVRVDVTGLSTPVVMTLNRKDDTIVITPPEPKVMVLAYGATRLLSTDGSAKRDSRIHIGNLFDPYAALNDGHPWLYEAPEEEFDRYVRALSVLLPRADGARFYRRDGQIHVEAPGVKGTLEALSSGYQAVLALAIDIISVMRLGWQEMEVAEGVVLIDEIDAHLHPRWKMRIVQSLRKVFPRLQFIASSHEPLTLRGLDRHEVVVLKRRLDGRVDALTAENADFPSPKLMRVEQLLTSDFFGLDSTEGLEVDAMFEEYYALLAARERDAEQQQRLEELRSQLEADRRIGLTQREQLVYEAADAFLAERKAEQAGLPDEVRQAAVERLRRLWDTPVKIRGYRIELGEIEARLAALTNVREAVVLAREDASGEKHLVAYYLSDAALPLEALRQWMSEGLPGYMMPSAYVWMARWPLTPNGKLDRQGLPSPEKTPRPDSDLPSDERLSPSRGNETEGEA